MVLDSEIAVPEDRGLTHIDGLSEAISERHGTTMRSSAKPKLLGGRSIQEVSPTARYDPDSLGDDSKGKTPLTL